MLLVLWSQPQYLTEFTQSGLSLYLRPMSSVPVLDKPVPAACGDSRGLNGVPGRADARSVRVRLEPFVVLTRFPVPEENFALAVAGHEELPVRRERNLAGESRVRVSFEYFFAV